MQGVLFLQSEYSLLQSLIKIEELFENAKNNNYSFLALTDSTLYGSYELFKLAKKYNIKPVLGLSVKVFTPNESTFLIYVKNQIGYQNLLKINLLQEKEEKISLDQLINYQEGLIFVSGGFDSTIDQTILYGNENEVINIIKNYNSLFNDFYVGLSSNYEIQNKVLKPFINNLLKTNQFKVVPIHQTKYVKNEDRLALETLMKIDNQNNLLNVNSNFGFLTEQELKQLSTYDLNSFINSINFKLTFPKYEMPKYLPNNENEYLKALATKGLKRRIKLNNIKEEKIYFERLAYELEVIINKGFTNYFLIVYDFIRYAKQNDILVGPGRGSASGALVSYSLGITEVDPIKYNLLFERFLNIERMSMPDIDIDFPDNKRDFVIDYVKNKYGKNHIASITTFDRFQVRSSIRDIARTLDIPTHRTNGIIQAVLTKKIDKSDELVNKVLNVSNKISGLTRHTGTHAAGIILANQDLSKSLPLKQGPYNFMQIAYDAKTLESLGLYKIDFLGIRNLTIISDILLDLKQRNINFDLATLNLEDEKTYQLLSSGNTTGIFQLESSGMRNVLKKLKPENFEDIVATLALFRPGPMANIDVYIARKEGASFNYLHQDLEEILKPTYGIIIYQEQIMQIAYKFAGMSLLEADNLRVGISKKDKDILETERIKFVSGSIKMGYSEKLANDIYNLIVEFANYGFNRSHSVSYSLVSYQMAYLKANHYLLFMKTLLNSVIGNKDQTEEYIKELKNNNIETLPPNINLSGSSYLIRDNKLLIPLTQIKGISSKVYEKINEERRKGLFTSYQNFKERLKDLINETQLVNLINSGALDDFKLNRKTMNNNLSLDSSIAAQFIKDFVVREVEEHSFVELQQLEKEAIGINVLYDFVSLVKTKKIKPNSYLTSEINNVKKLSFNLIGYISKISKHTTKNNKTMYFVTLTDSINDLDITVFPSDSLKIKDFKINDHVYIYVKKDNYQNRVVYNLIDIEKFE